MGIYDLKSLRTAAEANGFKGTDEQLILETAKLNERDPADLARYLGHDLGGKWGNRLGASADSYQAGMYGLAEAVTGSDWARRNREENEAASALQREIARGQGAISSYKDIGGVGDFFDYAGGLAIDSAPYLAEAAMGGLAARGLSTGLRTAASAARDIGAANGGVGMLQAERQIAKQLATRSLVGGAVASYPSAVADILQNQREANPGGQTDLMAAGIGGIPYAALNALGIEGAVARGGNPLMRGLGRLDDAHWAKRAVGNAGVNAFKEGVSETGQEVINQGFGRMAVDPRASLLDADVLERYGESFVGGAVLGGMMGGARRSEAWHDKKFDQAWQGEVAAADRRVDDRWNAEQLAYEQAAGNTPMTRHNYGDGSARQSEMEQQVDQDAYVGQMVDLMNHRRGLPTTAEGQGDLFGAPGEHSLLAGRGEARGAPSPEDLAFLRGQVGYTSESGPTGAVAGADRGAIEVRISQLADLGEQAMAAGDRATALRINREIGELESYRFDMAQQLSDTRDQVGYAQAPAGQRRLFPMDADVPGMVEGSNDLQGQILAERKAAEDARIAQAVRQSAETRAALKAEAKGRTGMEGTAAVDLYGELKDLHEGKVITEDEFVGALALISTRENGKVRKQIKEFQERAQTQPAQAQGAAAPAGPGGPQATPALVEAADPVSALRDLQGTDRELLHRWLGIEFGEDGQMTLAERADPLVTIAASMPNTKTGSAGMSKQAAHKRLKAILKGIGLPENDPPAKLRERLSVSLAGTTLEDLERNVDAPVNASDDVNPATSDDAFGAAPDAVDEPAADDVTADLVDAQRNLNASAMDLDSLLEDDLRRGNIIHMDIEEAATEWDEMRGPGSTPWHQLDSTIQVAWVRRYAHDIATGEAQESLDEEFKSAREARALHRGADRQDARAANVETGADAETAGRPEQAGRAEENAQEVDTSEQRVEEAPKSGQVAPKFSKATGTGSTVAAVQRELAKLGIKDAFGRVQVVQSLADLPADIQRSVTKEMGDRPSQAKVQAFVHNGRAYLIAENIDPRNARAVFLHEVGSHLGLENLLTAREFTRLAKKITQWADANDGSLESRLARKAIERAGAANTPDIDLHSEVIAYFVEEAVRAGVDPTAQGYKGELARWFSALVRAMKEGLRRLNMFNADSLTAQDIVDMAYGAAHLELQESAEGSGQAFSKAGPRQPAPTVRDENGNLEYEHDGIQLMFPQETERFEVIPQAGQRILDYAVMPAGQFDVLGNVQLLVDAEGKPVSLLDINMTQRRRGAGEKVVAAILHAHPDLDLNISNIVTGARGFWEKLGVPTQNLEDGAAYEGTLNLEILEEAQRGRSRGAARKGAGRNAGTGQGADARAESRGAEALGKGQTGGLKFSLAGAPAPSLNALPPHLAPTSSAQANALIRRLPPTLQPAARGINEVLRRWGNAALSRVMFTEDLLNRAATQGLKAAIEYKHLARERVAAAGAHERQVLDAVTGYHALPERLKGRGPGSVNQFLYRNTMSGQWGFEPDWLPKGTVTVDPKQKSFYDALGAEGQGFVRAVYKLGHESLQQKKAIIRETYASEYDALIQVATDPAAKKQLEADRDAGLKQFGSLMRLSGTVPYAPLKRFGNTVVFGYSQEYSDADEAFRRDGTEANRKALRALQSDEKHYFVDFADGQIAAAKMKDDLAKVKDGASPRFAYVFDREREEARNELYGGSATLTALSKLRAAAEQYGGEDSKVHQKMAQTLADLYLMQLAEDSARKSELARKNVAGDIDMIRSLETQGLADARFLSGVKYGKPMLDQFHAMRQESRRLSKNDQFAATQLMNEIMRRHVDSLDYQEHPLVNTAARMTSLMMLATSPSYYIQNATQPWVMSLPWMAQKHDYLKVAAALKTAYADIWPVLKAGPLLGQLDFRALLDDTSPVLNDAERRLVRELLNSGRLDIGMLTELGEQRVEGENSLSKAGATALRAVRGVQLKSEAVNRLVTALAAYRLEQNEGHEKAVAYADEVIQNTHGDYGSWNAPRVFNTAWGKLGLQFRKFQLIQLTYMAKMLHESVQGESKEARAGARKAFLFTMGQAAVLGGAKGLPIYWLASTVLAKLFGDEDEPPDYFLRRMIGDKDVADLLLDGVPAAVVGFNGNALGTFSNAARVFPFVDADLSDRDSVTQLGFAAAFGPTGGQLLRWADGLGYMDRGEYYKGVEHMLPKGALSIMRAGRVATEGVKQKDGDRVMSPDEVTLWDTLQQAVGFTPQRQNERMYRQNTARALSESARDDGSRVKADYSAAARARDTEGMAEARAAWGELQDRRARQGFERQPLSELLKAPQAQAKREADRVGPLYGNKGDRGMRERVAEL